MASAGPKPPANALIRTILEVSRRTSRRKPVPVSPLHVLVIEDERDVLDLLDGHLQRLGCRVSRAETGEEGLDQARADPPDVVIVDVLLPGMDGREVARLLRADPRTRR